VTGVTTAPGYYGGRLGTLTKVMGLRHSPDAAADAWRRIFAFFGEDLHWPAQDGPAQDGPSGSGPA
jgi:hypothetical protein